MTRSVMGSDEACARTKTSRHMRETRARMLVLLPVGLWSACGSGDSQNNDIGRDAAGVDAADVPGVPVVDAGPALADAPVADVALTVEAQSAEAQPIDESIAVESGGATDGGSCPQLLQQPHTNDLGTIYWTWRYDWQEPNLEQICIGYGTDARMVVEVLLSDFAIYSSDDPPACTGSEIESGGSRVCGIPGSFRFEFPCSQGSGHFETQSPNFQAAYAHVESALFANPPRQVLRPAVDCPRLLLPSTDVALPPPTFDGGVDACPGYPPTWRLDDSGTTLWWSHFSWAQDDLASVCASYGADAKMVLELTRATNPPAPHLPPCTNSEVMGGGTRACAIADAWRIEAPCTAGELLFESSVTALGSIESYYHVESAQVPDAPRRLVAGDATCVREIRPGTGPVLSPGDLAAWSERAALPDGSVGDAMSLLLEPAANGQACRFDGDCPRPNSQICFVDSMTPTCPDQPVGRCVPNLASNCILYQGCACALFFTTTCTTAPGYKCGHLGDSSNRCSACILTTDAGMIP